MRETKSCRNIYTRLVYQDIDGDIIYCAEKLVSVTFSDIGQDSLPHGRKSQSDIIFIFGHTVRIPHQFAVHHYLLAAAI